MNVSTEELQHMLAQAPRGLLYYRDELAGWLGDHDRYGGHGGDRAFYLECWNGSPFVVDRVKHRGDPIRIARAALAIIGGMQPDRLRQALAGPDDGLGARFAYIFPEPVPIGPLSCEADASARARSDRLLTAARRLSGLAMDCGSVGEPTPRVLRLDPEAFALFDDIRCDAMTRARSARGLAAGWHGKTGRALRLAIVFDLLSWAARGGEEPSVVGADAMARAGEYLDYLSGMLDRVTAGLALSAAEADAAAILHHILATSPQRINERDLYQRPDWSWLRESAHRAAAFAELERRGIVRRTARAGRGRPAGDWDVSPRLTEWRP
jgi:putative DNA primase/helicase